MNTQDVRRAKLRQGIDEHFQGNVSKFATAAGKAQSQVADMLDGRKPFGEKVARSIEEAVGWPPHFLDSPTSPDTVVQSDQIPIPTKRRVPVVGTAQLGDDGFWTEFGHPPGNGDGHLDVPSDDRNAYAVRVVGDSMHPRIRSGEFVLCEPNHPYGPGDEVLVVTTDGRSMVKEFLYDRDGQVVLHSVNDKHGRLTLAAADIEKIHFVAAIVKSARWRHT